MKVGILELQCNAPLVYTVSKLCPAQEVIIFTTQKLFPRIKDMYGNTCNCKWYLKNGSESTKTYLSKVEKICEALDLLIVITISNEVIPFLSFNPNCKKLLVIHNINEWFYPEPYLKKQLPKKRLLDKSYFLIRSFIYDKFKKWILLPRFDGVIVIYSPLRYYIIQNTHYSKPVLVIPWTLYEENGDTFTRNDNTIRFIVPGGVNSKRRDYKLIYDVFKDLFLKYDNTISLELLGEPTGNGTNILKHFKELKTKGYNITFYQEWVSREPYKRQFKHSDIAILPMREFYGPEIYGLTKGTATLFDCISYTTPFILPVTHPQTKHINTRLVYRNKNDLLGLLEKIITNNTFLRQIKEEVFELSQHFTLEKQRELFTQQLRGVLD